MEKTLLVANWKSHKSYQQTQEYFRKFVEKKDQLALSRTEIVICPSFPSLESAKTIVDAHALPVQIGVQTISQFEEGAYTGEVAASQIQSVARYVIIGHSERRQNFGETEEIIEQKVAQAHAVGLSVILCVQGGETPVYENVACIAYEPISAIGTGNPDSPENVTAVLSAIHEKAPNARLLYGGSVDPETISQFLSIKHIHGFLVGGASLDPDTFLSLVSACETRNSY